MLLQTVQAQTSQVHQQDALKRLSDKIDRSNRDKVNPAYSESFENNPLVFNDWYFGRVFFRDKTDMDSIRFNFDFDINAVVVQFNMGIYAISLKPDAVESFILHDKAMERRFIRKTKADFKDIKLHMPFFEVLLGKDSGNDLTILKQYQKEQVSADNRGSYKTVGFKAETKTTYNFRSIYFIKTAEDNTYHRFGLNKKKILGLFDKSKSKEVLNYVKSNNLKWSDEFEMMKVIREFLP